MPSLARARIRSISSIRVQLEIAKELLHQLENARDHQSLAMHKDELRWVMKLKSLGLSSLQ
jgi:hypothetical protein